MRANAYQPDPRSSEQMAEDDRAYGALAEALRGLVDASLHTRVDHETAAEVTATVEALTERLRKEADPDYLGVLIAPDGTSRDHGNAAVGLRNPVAPPLHVTVAEDGATEATFHLGAAYEGPANLVHGGVSALVLDQVLGMAAASTGRPGMTGRLTLTYRRPTPLGDLTARAWVHEVDGLKTTTRGHILGPDGEPTVEAEGLFITPRWARDAVTEQRPHPQRFE